MSLGVVEQKRELQRPMVKLREIRDTTITTHGVSPGQASIEGSGIPKRPRRVFLAASEEAHAMAAIEVIGNSKEKTTGRDGAAQRTRLYLFWTPHSFASCRAVRVSG
jgi:hypothetical protein